MLWLRDKSMYVIISFYYLFAIFDDNFEGGIVELRDGCVIDTKSTVCERRKKAKKNNIFKKLKYIM